ncbi:hypothetical protein RVR_316 [Actinacidiphila reveromycinica]|uniref:Uncharacterized protein n=1 Tax=Actinacidiphila reveromycinica TaxID=659352 RepID=A0A7U3VLE6_9ACTN|nr:hypothetical protein [Streptomyces sp. SN-593]BBA95454.1 hypothetical protein RVR_316 [Streptomyces sp. SN-593]
MSTPATPAASPAPASAPAPAPAATPAQAGPAGPSAPGPGAGAPPPGRPGGAPAASGGAAAGRAAGSSAPRHQVGAGGGAARATARSGLGSARSIALREARVRVVRGDAVQGDKIVVVAGGHRGVTLRALSDATVQAARFAFQDPPRWSEIRSAAWRQRSVVLRGPAGSGRSAAAVRLLQAAGTASWYAVDSVAELAGLTTLDDLAPGAGLVVGSPRDAADLRGPQLENLEGLLERADARLVLTVGPEVRLDRTLAEYVQQLARPDDLGAVMAAHLAHRTDEDTAAALLADSRVAGLADTLLGGSAACRDAARLAAILADGILDTASVRALFAQGDGDDADTWFESLGDPVLRTHAIALAFLNGLPREDVALAADALLRRFESGGRLIGLPAAADRTVPRARDPFALPLDDHLDRLRARTVPSLVRGDSGWLPCTVAEYRDDAMPRRVIRHVWSQYRVQAQLLEWVGELVDSPSLQVRGFAGTALGLLATESFDLLAGRVFPEWICHAESGDRRREAVGYALRMCVDDPALHDGVRALVEGWFQDGDWQAQAAAARAYGLCLGGGDLASAVESLVLLARVDHLGVAVAIGDSLADLMVADVERNAAVVLDALTGMFGKRRSRATGHLCFLILVDALAAGAQPAAPGDQGARPTLLHLSVHDPALRETLAWLWSEVIGGGLFDEETSQVLGRWAAQAEHDAGLMDDLLRMLRHLAERHTRVRQLLLRYADGWEGDHMPRPLRRAAGLLRAELNPRRAAPVPSDPRGEPR